MNKSYFTIQELCDSSAAKKYKIDNTPSEQIKSNLKKLIDFLNPLREAWGSPIKVNSGYRCEELNNHKDIKGSKTSAHLIGFAADLTPKNGQFYKFKDFVVNYLKDKQFDQCIIERNSKGSKWIHIGLYDRLGRQRKQCFKLIK